MVQISFSGVTVICARTGLLCVGGADEVARDDSSPTIKCAISNEKIVH